MRVGARERLASRSRSATTASAAPTRPPGTGLRGLEDRVAALEGELAVREPRGRGHDRAGEDPVRVVVADDSTLLREGVVRLLEEAGLEVVGQAADGEELLRKVRAHKPDVAVVDVRMPPDPHRRGAARRPRDPRRAARRSASSSSPSTSRSPTRASCWPRAPRGSATCSRTGSPTSRRSPTRCAGSAPAARRSTPRSSPQMLGRAPPRRPARRAHPARARGPGADGRGPLQRRDRRRAGRHRTRGREARDRDLRQARPPAQPEDHRRVLAVLRFIDQPD